MRVAVRAAVMVVVDVAVFVVMVVHVIVGVLVVVRFNRSRSAQSPEMPVRTRMRMSVDITSMPVEHACIGAAHVPRNRSVAASGCLPTVMTPHMTGHLGRRALARRSQPLISASGHKYGAFMEPSGRNSWQPAANEHTPKTAKTSQNRCRGLRPVAAEP